MSQLEDALSELKGLTGKGHSVEEVQCAASMLSSAKMVDIEIELSRIREQLENIEVNLRGAD